MRASRISSSSTYDFKVHDDIVGGIVWNDQFWKDTNGQLHMAHPLFQTIGMLYELAKLLQP